MRRFPKPLPVADGPSRPWVRVTFRGPVAASSIDLTAEHKWFVITGLQGLFSTEGEVRNHVRNQRSADYFTIYGAARGIKRNITAGWKDPGRNLELEPAWEQTRSAMPKRGKPQEQPREKLCAKVWATLPAASAGRWSWHSPG